jgi:hypothetical protein
VNTVRMVQPSEENGLPSETGYKRGIAGKRGVEDFDSDATVEERIVSEVDGATGAATDLPTQAVPPGDQRIHPLTPLYVPGHSTSRVRMGWYPVVARKQVLAGGTNAGTAVGSGQVVGLRLWAV